MPDPQKRDGSTLAEQIERLLACPRCRSSCAVHDTEIRCSNPACGFSGSIADDVAIMIARDATSYFDDKHEMLAVSHEGEGVKDICYQPQADLLESVMPSSGVILDVGCGSDLPYTPSPESFVIGLDASLESVRANMQVDLRVYGSATAMPLPDHAIDCIVSFYAVHHMTGQTVRENRRKALAAFREFGRVLKPGGELIIFEASPRQLVWVAEKHLWNVARSILGPTLDMFFYSPKAYETLGKIALPGAQFTQHEFRNPWFRMLPLSFSIPWAAIPRGMIPMRYMVYRWKV
jgi:ubiquinone/menaquinone biosynthesis C-methylase UbiE